jgi:HrpA-like RNA helicase
MSIHGAGGIQPTLLREGFVQPQKWYTTEEKNSLSNMRGIDFIMNWFNKRIPHSQGGLPEIASKGAVDKVLIIKAQTASGKSTIIPPEFFNRFFEGYKKSIACTQPRVLTAVDIPKDILQFNPKLKMGENVGFQTGVVTRKPVKGIIYMTIGVLLQQLKTMSDADFMNKYSIVIVDETHARDINVDLTLYMMKKFLNRNAKKIGCPFLVLMSATFDTAKFAKYYKVPKNVIDVKGASFPIEEHYLEYASSNYIEDAISQAITIHEEAVDDLADDNDIRDILIFVNGAGAINKMQKALDTYNMEKTTKNKILVVPLNSQYYYQADKEFRHLYSKIKDVEIDVEGKSTEVTRRVIISTNIAETGVTIDTLKYVIDTGYVISSEYNPVLSAGLLKSMPVTQGMAMQRRGRVGRKAPGHWYPLFTKEIFDKLQVDEFAELIKGDINEVMLAIIILESELKLSDDESVFAALVEEGDFGRAVDKTGVPNYSKWFKKQFSIDTLDMLELPSADSMHESIEKLYVLGAFNGEYPTKTGLIMNLFRKIPLESRRMILEGYRLNVGILDLVTIAIGLTLRKGELFTEQGKPYKKAKGAGKFSAFGKMDFDIYEYSKLKTKLLFGDDFIQFIFIVRDFLVAHEEFKSIYALKKWCEKNGLSYAQLMNFIELRDELVATMATIGFNPYMGEMYTELMQYSNSVDLLNYTKKIKQCIYAGYKMNTAMWNPAAHAYITERRHVKIIVDSDSIDTNFPPKYIIYNAVTTKATPENKYQHSVDHISALDGFINIDHTYLYK